MIDFLGIGAQKAGTSWLMFNLKRHPGVWTPFVKEVHYFDVKYLGKTTEMRIQRMEEKVAAIISRKNLSPEQARYWEKLVEKDYYFTEQWYRDIFSIAPAGKLKGEFTPFYCCLPIEGIQHVKALAPQVKLIYLIRDPVDRAVSSLGMRVRRGSEMSPQQIVSDADFQLRGDYQRNIGAWESVFDQSQILYIPFGRIRSEPERVMRDVEEFFGLPGFDNYPNLSKPRNSASMDAVDKHALELIEEYSEVQYSFLEGKFGRTFVEEIK